MKRDNGGGKVPRSRRQVDSLQMARTGGGGESRLRTDGQLEAVATLSPAFYTEARPPISDVLPLIMRSVPCRLLVWRELRLLDQRA